jgi:hypothetical protein
MFAAIIRRRPSGGRGRSTAALPPRAPAAATESSSEAKLSSSVSARDLITVSVSGGASGNSSSTNYTSSRGSVLSSDELGVPLQIIDDEEKPEKLEHAKHLARLAGQ